ncbi:MAG: hypothetical protein ACRDRU_00365 [Pseudonocardiaceae bacterium]
MILSATRHRAGPARRRVLRMVTWLAGAAAGDPVRAGQVRFWLATLRDGTAPVGWDGF